MVNGYFQRADFIDELSLVVASIVAGKDDKPLFTDSNLADFELVNAEKNGTNLVLNYKKK